MHRVLLLRSLLVYHLQVSLLYDAAQVGLQLEGACGVLCGGKPLTMETLGRGVGGLPLWPELALVSSRQGNHIGALQLWALSCGQVSTFGV